MNFDKIKTDWIVKPRTYKLTGTAEPPLRQIRTKHTYDNHLIYFDEVKKENRELRYLSGGNSPFVDDQPDKGVKVSHVFFRDGYLITGDRDIALQQFLVVHPDNGRIFEELRPDRDAEEQVVDYEEKATAYEVVKALNTDELAQVMHSQIGDGVFKIPTKEIKRDLYIMADSNPTGLIEASKNEVYKLRYLGAKAIYHEILLLADGDRTVKWKKNGRKLLTVSVDETPQISLANFFLTDDGIEVKAKILESLKEFE